MAFKDLVRLARFTVLLGKNGSGKSTLLRNEARTSATVYISPERGGRLKYDAGIEQNIANDPNWMTQDRQKNRTEHFRQQSAFQFRNLEILVLREIEQNQEKRRDSSYSFDTTLQRINGLLHAVELRRADRGFEIYNKTGQPIDADHISSGESELIALSIEVLVFARSSKKDKVLLLDEPDVHLHPDLQQRFVAFIENLALEFDFKVVIATHSTAIIGAFSRQADLQIVPITVRNQTEFRAFRYSAICHAILPVFGAHPLSTQFNRSPVLLLEGDDDKRVWDQFVRSANGRYSFSTCVVGTASQMHEWEQWLNDYLPSIYDSPKAFSLRDLDTSAQENLDDYGCVMRARLNCYAIENLLLTNECLAMHGLEPGTFEASIRKWIGDRPDHPACSELQSLADHFCDRRTLKIKAVRNVVVALLGTPKPWEVLVGKLLADNADSLDSSENSVRHYLGNTVRRKLLAIE